MNLVDNPKYFVSIKNVQESLSPFGIGFMTKDSVVDSMMICLGSYYNILIVLMVVEIDSFVIFLMGSY